MAVFVGVNTDGSRVRSNRVGLAVSTANPGSASEGDVYYNSTDSQIKSYDGSSWNAEGAGGGGTVELVASGSLTNGQPVVLLSNGKVSGITSTSATYNPSSASDINSENTSDFKAVYHTGVNKIVIVYTKSSDYKSYMRVGETSGSGVSWGSESALHGGGTSVYQPDVTYLSSNKVLICYKRAYPYAQIATLNSSDTSFSLGTQQQIDSDSAASLSLIYDTQQGKPVLFWEAEGDSEKGKAVVISYSGTTPSFGSIATFSEDRVLNVVATYDSNAQKTVVFFSNKQNGSNPTAVVGTVSGTSITFGDPVVVEVVSSEYSQAGYDSDQQKVFYAYRARTVSGKFSDNSTHIVVGTVSGTTITFGKPVIPPKPHDTSLTGSGSQSGSKLPYDPIAKKIGFFSGTSNSPAASFVIGRIVDDTIEFDVEQPVQYRSATNVTVNSRDAVYDEDNDRIIIIFKYTQYVTNKGQYRVVRLPYKNTTITSDNFIGFSDAAYTNGQTATIQIAGSIDDAQSGLTPGKKYYVQADGTLKTTEDTPSVIAGTALASNKILIRK